MNSHHPNADVVARKYIGASQPLERLGWGVDGVVYHDRAQSTAVKVHSRAESFNHELAAYNAWRSTG